MRHAFFCESICTYIRNALRVCIMLFDQEHCLFFFFVADLCLKRCLCLFWALLHATTKFDYVIWLKLARLNKVMSGNTAGGSIAYYRRAFNRTGGIEMIDYHNLVKEMQLNCDLFQKYFRLTREPFTSLLRHPSKHETLTQCWVNVGPPT